MARHLHVRDRADLDIVEISTHIAIAQPAASQRFVTTLRAEFERLQMFPGAGASVHRPPRHLLGLRFWPVPGFRTYLIYYLPSPELLEVVRVVHGARNARALLRER